MDWSASQGPLVYLIHEISEPGELQGQCNWVTETKEQASGDSLVHTLISDYQAP